MMPKIISVAELQRQYRAVVTTMKKEKKPLVVVSNGKADIVVLDPSVYEEQLNTIEYLKDALLQAHYDEAIAEHKKGKTIKLPKSKTLLDIIEE